MVHAAVAVVTVGAVIRLEALFLKTTVEPPLYFKPNSAEQVAAIRAANEKRGGPVFLQESECSGFVPRYKPQPQQQRRTWPGPGRR